MKVDKIEEILDLAVEARKQGLAFNPMFVGEAGLGKSEAVRAWVKQQQKKDESFGFVDFRTAYYEGPDFVGFPETYKDEDGKLRMIHALPKMWPTKGRGLILFEEPNRGNTMVMNCLMQILTDREVGTEYKLPEGWIIAGAMNPEGAKYDVSAMDTALADRFEFFSIDYDHNTFIDYIEIAKWDAKIQMFLKSSQWAYMTPDKIGKDGKYISPRTWSKMNAAEKAGGSSSPKKRPLHHILCRSILGKHIGEMYWKSCWDDAPVLASDILKNKEKAIAKLALQSTPGSTYSGDKVDMTVQSVVDNYGGWFEGRKGSDGKDYLRDENTIDEPTMVEIAKVIPADQAVNLLKSCGYKSHKGAIGSFIKDFVKRNPECIDLIKDSIKIDRATK